LAVALKIAVLAGGLHLGTAPGTPTFQELFCAKRAWRQGVPDPYSAEGTQPRKKIQYELSVSSYVKRLSQTRFGMCARNR
jgi:hypothetical protein